MRKNQHMAIPHFSIPFFVSIMKKEAFATVEKLWLLGGRQSVLCKLGLIPWKWETFLLLLPRKMPPILAPSPSFSFFFSSSFSFLPLLILEETRRLAATASPLQSSYRSQLVWVGKNRDRSRRGLYTSSNCFGIRVYTLFPSLSLCICIGKVSSARKSKWFYGRRQHVCVQRKPSRLMKLFNFHQNRFEWHVRDVSWNCLPILITYEIPYQ